MPYSKIHWPIVIGVAEGEAWVSSVQIEWTCQHFIMVLKMNILRSCKLEVFNCSYNGFVFL